MHPQELDFVTLSSPRRAIYASSLLAYSHAAFSSTWSEFGLCLRTHQECYLLLFEMLVSGAGDRVEFLWRCSRQK